MGGCRLRDTVGCEKATGKVSYLGDTTVHLCKKRHQDFWLCVKSVAIVAHEAHSRAL